MLSGWLADQLEASNKGVLRLPCEVNGVDPGGDPPGEALARVAFGGQALVTRLYDLRHRSSERPSLPRHKTFVLYKLGGTSCYALRG